MPVENLEPDGKVHKGYKGGETGCGLDTNKNPENWKDTDKRITCNKDGCKN